MPETQTFVLDTVLGDYVFAFTNPAQLNQLWGQIASDFGQTGTMGQHSSEAGTFTPNAGDGGRQGVGNLSNTDPRFVPQGLTDISLSEGAQGLHAAFQGARLGDPNLPPGAVEATVGPFIAESNGQVSVTFIPDLVI